MSACFLLRSVAHPPAPAGFQNHFIHIRHSRRIYEAFEPARAISYERCFGPRLMTIGLFSGYGRVKDDSPTVPTLPQTLTLVRLPSNRGQRFERGAPQVACLARTGRKHSFPAGQGGVQGGSGPNAHANPQEVGGHRLFRGALR